MNHFLSGWKLSLKYKFTAITTIRDSKMKNGIGVVGRWSLQKANHKDSLLNTGVQEYLDQQGFPTQMLR